MRFDKVMEVALYEPEVGFFATATEAGRRGHFLTSPEVGPLFGAVLAQALDQWWEALGFPDPFVVVEAGAGRGSLAIAVRQASPACCSALTYVMVERSPSLRQRQSEHLPIESPALALLPLVEGEDEPRGQGSGPRFISLPALPALPVVGVVLANELLDNLAFRVVRRREHGWEELYAGVVPGRAADPEGDHASDRAPGSTGEVDRELGILEQDFDEVWLRCDEGDRVWCEDHFAALPHGVEVPRQQAIQRWIREADDTLERGFVVVFDYAVTTQDIIDRPSRSWLRTYAAHGRGNEPLRNLGLQDITADVHVDALLASVPYLERSTQADVLRRFGIDALVEEGRAIWQERAVVGDLSAVVGRSRVREAEALLDPDGLGAFSVFTFAVGL